MTAYVVPLPADNGKSPVAVDAVPGVRETALEKQEKFSPKEEQEPLLKGMAETSEGRNRLSFINTIRGVPTTPVSTTF